jgi:uncharacterized protein YndB with AHSA1/START domain
MIKLDFSQQIQAPVERVFAYVTDLRAAAEWQDGVVESSPLPDAPPQIGTKVKTVRLLMGQRLETSGVVTEFVPNKAFAFKSTSGPVQFNMSQTFSPANGGAQLNTHMEMEAADFMKVAEPVIAASLKQQFDAQEKKLKEILES